MRFSVVTDAQEREARRIVDEAVGSAALLPGQLAALFSDVAITIIIAGIRGGKTHVGALKTLLYALEHSCALDEVHLVCSPTFPMSRVPVEKLFKLLYDKTLFPICPLIRYVKSERLFILAAADGGVTRIKVVSLHDPDKVRGIKALSAWLDEAAYISEYAWQVIQGRLADVAGPCWITTTPAGYNWLFELYERAVDDEREKVPLELREIKVVHWTSLENLFNNQKGFTRLAAGYDARMYAQEVLAKFVKGRGLIYYAFTRSVHVKRAQVSPRLPLIVGQDFNVDPMASVLMQPITSRDGQPGLHIVAERKQPDSNTYDLVAWLKHWCGERHIPERNVTIYPDASGKQRSTSGKSDFQILRAAGFKVDAPTRNPLVKDRINCVNGLHRPMRGAPRLFVDPDCEQVIEGLEKQIWKPESDPPEPDKEHGFDHLNDAIGYPCWRKFPLRMRAGTGHVATTRRAA